MRRRPSGDSAPPTHTPIKHVIVIIGENHSFDNVFATYQPPKGQHIENLLSEGIVTEEGRPRARTGARRHSSRRQTPRPTPSSLRSPAPTSRCRSPTPPTSPRAATGRPANSPDKRFPADLPNAPYQITKYVPYFDSHLAVHRRLRVLRRLRRRPDPPLLPDVPADDGVPRPAVHLGAPTPPATTTARSRPRPSSRARCRWATTTWPQGDAPILRDLAQHYAISDNYHQAVQGGTGANHIALGTGFAASYQTQVGQGGHAARRRDREPQPQAGHEQQLHPGRLRQRHRRHGGSYSECADHGQPGVGAIVSYLDSLPYKAFNNCQPGRYYLLNNYNAGLQRGRHGEHRALHGPAAEDRLRDDRQRAVGARHQLGLLRRGLQQRRAGLRTTAGSATRCSTQRRS